MSHHSATLEGKTFPRQADDTCRLQKKFAIAYGNTVTIYADDVKCATFWQSHRVEREKSSILFRVHIKYFK